MGKSQRDSRGFTLIAALLLTLLLSAVAVGLLYMVTNEQHMGGNDLENNLAFYGAEAGIENLTAQLSQLYQTSQAPTAAAIQALTSPANFPTAVSGSNITNIQYAEPPITWPYSDANGNPSGKWDIVGSGPNQGMVASLIQFNLQVTATRNGSAGEATTNSGITPTGASVNLTRTVEVALLPAFEFGVFCDGDCDYFAGPNFNFGGRVHTNSNLFLASGSKLTFTDKLAAVGQVILDQLENGHPTSSGYTGAVYVPDAALGCPPAPSAGPAANCPQLTAGSWTGGFPQTGTANSAWTGISKSSFAGFIENGLTGATKLQLPFVGASQVGAMDIIRRPQQSDTALLLNSRLYTKAEIRILLADNINDLHPERGATALDGDDVQLALPTAGGYKQLTQGTGAGNYMYFATGTNGVNGWVTPTVSGCTTPWPLLGEVTTSTPCQGAWLRVEYRNSLGAWVGVTREWLGYGFGRPYNMPPTSPWNTGTACGYYTTGPTITHTSSTTTLTNGGPFPNGQCYNPVSPAILILQQLQMGKIASQAWENDTSNTSNTAGNWIPINFYDAREGEPRDNGARTVNYATSTYHTTYTPCSASGVMNAVELDAGNLWLWLKHTGPYSTGSGNQVDNQSQGGYILYFSDHRGMRADAHAPYNTFYNGMPGSSGLEDTINSTSSTGVPSNNLEPATYYNFSPEDANGDGALDTQGEAFLGAGFNLSSTYMAQPYFPIPANPINQSTNQVNCNTSTYSGSTSTTSVYTGPGSPQNNMVTGPRHVLRLVDGGMSGTTSYLPHAASTTTYGNGFTVASEEPVYILGDYNSGISDPFWPSGGSPGGALHSAAGIIADAVTLLSNPPSLANLPVQNVGWLDVMSFLSPGDVSNRPANTSYYRVAIAAGKSIPFPQPGWAGQDFGTDGGMHNFLRYLENRGANSAQVNYVGSLISMYYSQYATGNFKCCNVVYGAPQRNYFFDTQFLNPNNLPPGTPMFQDVVSLSYQQAYKPQ
jgi:Tfp pilus assembly protein PilX